MQLPDGTVKVMYTTTRRDHCRVGAGISALILHEFDVILETLINKGLERILLVLIFNQQG